MIVPKSPELEQLEAAFPSVRWVQESPTWIYGVAGDVGSPMSVGINVYYGTESYSATVDGCSATGDLPVFAVRMAVTYARESLQRRAGVLAAMGAR